MSDYMPHIHNIVSALRCGYMHGVQNVPHDLFSDWGSSFCLPFKTTATGSGDPHYTTFDGRYYTFNGFGEFVLVEALSEDNTPVFTLQGRTGMVSFWQVTTHLALAFGRSDLAFHVSALANDS